MNYNLNTVNSSYNSDYYFWFGSIIVYIIIFIWMIIDSSIHHRPNRYMHILCGTGIIILGVSRSLSFMGLGSLYALTLIFFVGELLVAIGIFSIKPESSESEKRTSKLNQLTIIINLFVIVTLIILAVFVMKLGFMPSDDIKKQAMILFIGLIPIFAAIVYKMLTIKGT